jgi:tRNA(Ile)-lysidine synthase
MEKRFLEHMQKNSLIIPWQKILVAVSGGVDSIVLLSLLKKFQPMFCWKLAVAHVNHQLRPESVQEANFVKNEVQKNQLDYFETVWEEGIYLISGIEEKARSFRYSFLASLMKKHSFDILMTAHHGDDQIETQLMRWVRGNYLGNLKGIRGSQDFVNGKLIRPLLPFAKSELYGEAQRCQLKYFEDSSNKEEGYFRNRVRKQILPFVKKENPNAVVAANGFSKQIMFFEELLKESFLDWFKGKDRLVLDEFLCLSESKRYLYLLAYFQHQEIILKFSEIEKILEVLANPKKPNWQYPITDALFFVKSYKYAYVAAIEKIENVRYSLSFGESIFLSETEWLGFGILAKKEFGVVTEEFFTPASKIAIRHPMPKDRLMLTKSITKKLSRLFIDEKIPTFDRKKKWLIEDERGVLSVLGVRQSYLSREIETDKMKNKIVYVKTLKDDAWGIKC